MSLLNQDTSRNFLHVTDAKAKYKVRKTLIRNSTSHDPFTSTETSSCCVVQLFMRATQLDHIAQEFERTESSCARHRALVAAKEKVGLPRVIYWLPVSALCTGCQGQQ